MMINACTFLVNIEGVVGPRQKGSTRYIHCRSGLRTTTPTPRVTIFFLAREAPNITLPHHKNPPKGKPASNTVTVRTQLQNNIATLDHPLLSVLTHSDMISDASALPPDIPYSKPAPSTSPPSPSPPPLCSEDKTGADDDGPRTTSLASKKAPVSKVEDAPAHTVEGVSWVLRVGTVAGSQNGQSDTARENLSVPADTW